MTSDPSLLGLDEADFDSCFAAQPAPPAPLEDLRNARARHRRRLRAGAVSAVVAVMVVAGASWLLTMSRLDASPAGPPTTQVSRDPAGLRVISDDYYATRTVATETPDVASALRFVRQLADENRGDFGFPQVEGDRVVLPVASARAAPVAQATTAEARTAALMAYDNAVRAGYPRKTNPPDLLAKRLQLSPSKLQQFATHVDVVTGSRSIQAAYDLVERVYRTAQAQDPADVVLGGSYDETLDLVVLEMSKPVPSLSSALVAEFGTDTVGIHISSSAGAGLQDEVSNARLSGYLRPTADDSVTVRALTGEGDVVTSTSAEETDEQIRVRVTLLSPTGPHSDVGYITDQMIPLKHPVGDRTVVDAVTGETLRRLGQ